MSYFDLNKIRSQTKKIRKLNIRPRRLLESGITVILFACALVSVFVLITVFWFLVSNSTPFFVANDFWKFISGTVWRPISDFPSYGILPLAAGTFMITLVASLIAVPVGIGCTIYLSEIATPTVKKYFKPVIEILAGVPSVIFGLFAAIVLANFLMGLFHPLSRLNGLNGAVIIAIMMIPIMVSIAEEALNSVPSSLKEASYALGATKWETIRRTIIPAAIPGIVAAIILSMGRAIGETMAIIMATGNATQFTFNILQSMRTMTAALAIDMPEVEHNSMAYYSLFSVGLVLFVITFAINLIAQYVMFRYRERLE